VLIDGDDDSNGSGMRLLLTISLALWLAAAQAESVRMLVQSSPLAGSQYYALANSGGKCRLAIILI
jgi:hypothetical protein